MKRIILPLLIAIFVFGGETAFAARPCASQQKSMTAACKRGKRARACVKTTAAYNRCLSTSASHTPGKLVCIMVYAPVCARTADGELKTFSNGCVAATARAELVADGECASQ